MTASASTSSQLRGRPAMTVTFTSTSTSKAMSTCVWLLKALFLLTAAVTILVVRRNLRYARDPWMYMLPNGLLLTPFSGLTGTLWKHVVQYNTSRPFEPVPIPEMNATEYSFEALRSLTENFRNPAVVRGMFANTAAVQRWSEPGYLKARVGEFEVMAVANTYHDKTQDNRFKIKIADAFDDILENPDCRTYLFFPVKSRKNALGNISEDSHNKLVSVMNQMASDDLDLERIRPGFGSARHRNYYGAQFVAGRGHDNVTTTTGTGWHCAPGNNYFVQVAGRKQWYFIDQKDSALLRPLRGGVVNFQTGESNISSYMAFIPTKTVIMEPGDMLYNPDWSWHTIRNFPGLSIGTPIREFNISLSLRNNMLYTSAVLLNKIADELFGTFYGAVPKDGVRPWYTGIVSAWAGGGRIKQFD